MKRSERIAEEQFQAERALAARRVRLAGYVEYWKSMVASMAGKEDAEAKQLHTFYVNETTRYEAALQKLR